MDAPSSTFFTAPPDWGWLIVLYFVFGGLAGGCYLLATLIDLFARPQDRPLARMGYFIALPCIVVSGVLLLFDLSRPDRFWHLFLERHTLMPMWKSWSPMSTGSWALPLFGLFAFLSFLGALGESRHGARGGLSRLRPPGALGAVIGVLGSLLGLYVAGYTGVLLSVTNRPVWADTTLLGALLVVSAVSISAALMVLLGRQRHRRSPAVLSLHRIDAQLLVVLLVITIAMLVSLGAVAQGFLRPLPLLLLLFAVGIGMVAPLLLHWRSDRLGEHNLTVAAILVLAGGFILRTLVVFSGDGIVG